MLHFDQITKFLILLVVDHVSIQLMNKQDRND